MKKILYSTICAAAFLAIGTSCSDYLDTSSPSIVDAEFVFSTSETSRAAMTGVYETWRDCAQNKVFGDGLYYAADVVGSDMERHPEAFSNQPGRHYPECLYQNGTYAGQYGLLSYQKEDDVYASLYSVVSQANSVINAMESTSDFQTAMSGSTPTSFTQLYGEAIAMRATAYRELIKYFGDVPYVSGKDTDFDGLVGRDSIYDVCLAELVRVAPLMYRAGSIPGISGKNLFTRTYVEGLIGRMSLDAGGYQTRRGDIKRVDGNGNGLTYETMGSENNGASYGRRSDWATYYNQAKTYFKAVIDNPGNTKFYTSDPRATEKSGREYNNPYQYFFQQMMDGDANYADESIYEYPMQQGGGNDARSYSFGRPTKGGSKNNYPCKAYGQGRIVPAFYYGVFDPNDKRRDVSICVTGNDGASGIEKLIPFTPGSQANGGGIALNKWDESRMSKVWTAAQRKSGINGPYMRIAEIYLGYAEACAATGDDASAKQYLTLIRERSFTAGKANTEAFIASKESLLEAVIDERGFEFAGEGDRRWTLIRSGFFPKKIKAIKELTAKMIEGLKANGYYEFDNGNVISNNVYTKMVDGKTQYGFRLTAQCPEGKEDDPVLYPGWRGTNDNWSSYGLDYKTDTPATNVAIQGLFKHLSEAEVTALTADGYSAQAWGSDIVKYEDEYYKYFFYDYDYTKAPIYLWPFTPNVMSTGGFTNGYGFSQE